MTGSTATTTKSTTTTRQGRHVVVVAALLWLVHTTQAWTTTSLPRTHGQSSSSSTHRRPMALGSSLGSDAAEEPSSSRGANHHDPSQPPSQRGGGLMMMEPPEPQPWDEAPAAWRPPTPPPRPLPPRGVMRRKLPSLHTQAAERRGMRKLPLTGYSAVTAAALSIAEVQAHTRDWTTKAGVVGSFFGDELYRDLTGVSVARPSREQEASLVHSLAAFWKAVATVIDLHTDRAVWPPRWLPAPRAENSTGTVVYTAKNGTTTAQDRVHMIVWPDAPDLYDYDSFTTLLTSVEFSKDLCVHLGRHFTVTAFHPHFKNSPNLLTPERHSPFPTAGLQMGSSAFLELETPANNNNNNNSPAQAFVVVPKKPDQGHILPLPDAKHEDEEIAALADARIRNLDQTRAHYEVLFNSAAAPARDSTPSPSSATPVVVPGDSGLSAEEQLALTFRQERQRRTGTLPSAKVQEVICQWMDQQRYADSARRHVNPALEFMDAIDGYTVCTEKMGEKVYAEIWQTILDIYEKGQQADAEEATAKAFAPVKGEKEEVTPQARNPHFKTSVWLDSLSTGGEEVLSDEETLDEAPVKVVSSLFIATKFHTYNAQVFKRFAITINAALKRITDGRMFLEVFHPEYVGNKGYSHELRRSPFPMIQICYLVGDSNEAKEE